MPPSSYDCLPHQGTFEDPWAEGERRESKLVFIGKDLDANELAAGFNGCLQTPEVLLQKREALRFGIGAAVECKTGPGDWSTGTVLTLMYRDDTMPPGLVAPYQVKLDADGSLNWVQRDSDEFVRSSRRRSKRLRGSGRGADDEEEDEEED